MKLNFLSELATIVASNLKIDPDSDLQTINYGTLEERLAYKKAYQENPQLMEDVLKRYRHSIGQSEEQEN